MIKKNITYTDFNGEVRTETFYFNLSKVELLKLESSHSEGFQAYLEKIIADKNSSEMFNLFIDIITTSYGKKSEDGKRFVKSPEITEEFTQCNAFGELLMEIMSDTDKLTEFVNGLIPADLVEASKNRQDFSVVS